MKFIFLFEEFTDKTLKSNNKLYNQFYMDYKNDDNERSSIVAWTAEGSQERNFKLVSKYIKNGETLLDYGCGVGDFIKYLKDHNITISNYLGVDINNNFIKLAKKTYIDYNFKVIKNIEDVNGKWDTVCAIGVFTWFITKEEFIETIYKLHQSCNKRLILTLLNGDTPYDNDEFEDEDEENYWNEEYKKYSLNLFKKLFSDFKFSHEINGTTLLIKFIK